MKIKFGKSKTEYGPGVEISLSGEDVALAIYAYLAAHKVFIDGPATIRINGQLIKNGEMYIDPSGKVVYKGVGWSGRGDKY